LYFEEVRLWRHLNHLCRPTLINPEAISNRFHINVIFAWLLPFRLDAIPRFLERSRTCSDVFIGPTFQWTGVLIGAVSVAIIMTNRGRPSKRDKGCPVHCPTYYPGQRDFQFGFNTRSAVAHNYPILTDPQFFNYLQHNKQQECRELLPPVGQRQCAL
jgi:hypothetical protein